jgi:hypothetical protein
LREAERRERLSASGLLRPDEPALNLGDRLNTFDLDFGNFKFKKVAAHRGSLPLPKYRDRALRAYLPNTALTGLSPVLQLRNHGDLDVPGGAFAILETIVLDGREIGTLVLVL